MLTAVKDKEGNITVEIAPEAMEIPWVKDVYINDKHDGKPFFNKVIKWVFHVYSKDHALSGLSLSERKKNVIDIYFNGKMPKSGLNGIESNTRVQTFITGYNKLTKTITERMLDTLDEAINNERERIANMDLMEMVTVSIPYSIEIKIDNLYKKVDDRYVSIKSYPKNGSIDHQVKMIDNKTFAEMIKSSFKLIETYDEAKRKAMKESRDLVREFDGESWLERYFRQEKEVKKI